MIVVDAETYGRLSDLIDAVARFVSHAGEHEAEGLPSVADLASLKDSLEQGVST